MTDKILELAIKELTFKKKERMKTFKEYLTEAFTVREIDYGTNVEMNDKKIKHDSKFGNYTFIKFDDMYYVICIGDNNEVVFATSEKFSTKLNDYSYTRISKKRTNIIVLLSSIVFVIAEMLKTIEPNFIIFKGANKELDKVYGAMFKNNSFLTILKNHGYPVNINFDNYFIFSKNAK